MDFTKLNRQRDELKKARRRRDEWIRKVEDLEQKYQESENTCIHDMVHEAKVSPEQLSELLKRLATELPGGPLPEAAEAAGTDDETGSDEEAEPFIDDEKEAFDR